MSGKGIKLFKVLGIQISIDYTWFIVFALFAWSLAFGYFPFKSPGFTSGTYMAMGVISAILLFTCVLVHEVSHSYTANRLGLDISEITLFIFGGVAQLTKEPDNAKTELKIAIAGPLASVALAAVFWGVSTMVDRAQYPIFYAITWYLAFINIVLVVFNMIPGFPLDGGRVLRAVWWARTGDLGAATRAASNIGKGFAIFLVISGFLQIAFGNFAGGLWSIFIGVFLQQAAETGYRQVVIKKALEGLKVRDIMTRDVKTINSEESIAGAVENYFFKYHYACFPVTHNGSVDGILTLKDVRSVDRQRWQDVRVKDAMHSLHSEDYLSPESEAMEALVKMSEDHIGRFVVLDHGRLSGIISRRDIMKTLEFRAGLGA